MRSKRRTPRESETKSTKWKVFYPGDFYAWDLAFRAPVSKREVLQEVRERAGVKRLPAGTYVEPGSTNDWYERLSPAAKREQDELFRYS